MEGASLRPKKGHKKQRERPSRFDGGGTLSRCDLLFDELEVLEIDLQILSADVRDAQFASGHATEFVARVDDGVVVAVVQEADFTPSAVGEEFEAEFSSHLGHAEVEVHAGKGDVAVAFNRERTVFLPVDDSSF